MKSAAAETVAPEATARSADEPASGYAWYVLFVLIVAYTLAYVDRTVVTLMVAPIKRSLHLSDLEISLLHGLAFAIFYTVLGIPIARLADRHRRTTIIATGIVIWSGMTALCGLARGFGQLFAARVGVGVGEAALSPAAYSMLADSFPPTRLARAISIYTGAIFIGAGIALIAGGALIAAVRPIALPFVGLLEPWQSVFVLVGAPGLLVGAWVATLREPSRHERGHVEVRFPDLAEVVAFLRAHFATYGSFILGTSVTSLMWNGATAWIPTYFIRLHGWTPSQVGLAFGTSLMVFGTAGIVSGGFLCERLRARGLGDANLRVATLASTLAFVPGVAAPFIADPALSLGCFCLFLFAGAMPQGGNGAALQEITPNRMRAQVTAIYFFGLNIAGIGVGPTIVAAIGDHVFHDEKSIGMAIAAMIAIAAPLSALLLRASWAPYRRTLAARTLTATLAPRP